VWNASVSLSLFNRKITPVYPPQPQSGKLCTWLIYGILDSHRSLYEIVAFLKKNKINFQKWNPTHQYVFHLQTNRSLFKFRTLINYGEKKGRAYILFLRVKYTTTLDN
jgi:hypothetical protein